MSPICACARRVPTGLSTRRVVDVSSTLGGLSVHFSRSVILSYVRDPAPARRSAPARRHTAGLLDDQKKLDKRESCKSNRSIIVCKARTPHEVRDKPQVRSEINIYGRMAQVEDPAHGRRGAHPRLQVYLTERVLVVSPAVPAFVPARPASSRTPSP